MKTTCSGGFTLIEMMVTIAIVGILAALAAPSFQGMIINNRITAQANDLVSDLALARSEAIKRPGSITVCASSDGTSCGTDWSLGRIVFTDGGTAGTKDGSDEILRVREALKGENTLTQNLAPANYVQYSPSGFSSSSGTFVLCHSGHTGRNITISRTGRVATANTSSTCL